MSESKQKLPPQTDDHIVEVSLRHVILAFGGLILGSLTVGAGIIFVRDYAKYKRQKAIIDAAQQLLLTIQDGGQNLLWNEKKTESSSPMKTLKRLKKSSETLE
jgi:hypothetical protein